MAKKIKHESPSRPGKTKSGFSLDALPSKYVIPGVILSIIVLFLVFLNPLFFGGKLFQSGDIISSESMQPYLTKARDGFTLWNPHIFCGMPAYSIAVGYKWFNLVSVLLSVVVNIFLFPFATNYVHWVFYLIVFAITSFFLMKHLTKNVLVSLFTALATAFSTGYIVFLYIGHVTKLTSLCMFPLVFLLLLRMQKKIKLLDIFLLIVSLQLMLQGFHLQIIFYLILATAIYFIYYLIYSLVAKNKELTGQLLKSGGILAFAIGIALLIQLDNFTQIYEYTPYSTRGTKGIKELTQGTPNKAEAVLANNTAISDSASSAYYNYHTDWSFSPGEIATFIIPSYFGFGNSTFVEPGSGQEIDVNTYFGQMPFVDVAMYMGAVVFFLALYGAFTRFRDPLVQFLIILGLFGLFISFGKNLPFLFNLLFYHLPYFDKFRVPSMALVLVQFAVPMLAGFGLHEIISPKSKLNSNEVTAAKILRNIAITFSVFFIIALLAQSPLADGFYERAIQAKGDNPEILRNFQALQDHMKTMYVNDLLAAFGLTALAFWGGYLFKLKKLSATAFAALAIVIILVDLLRVDARGEKFTDAPDQKEAFAEPEYVKIIKAQNDKEPFRILNLKQRGPGSLGENSNYHAYFLLEDFYGYSAVKPRAFQDMMDVIGIFNPAMWKMSNVKYLILDKPYTDSLFTMVGGSGDSYVFRLNDRLNRYYFVNHVEQKPAIDVLNDLKAGKFNPGDVAYVQDAAPVVQKPDSTAQITLQQYADEVTKLDVNASGNNFLVFATSYQPKGWHATIDGKQTPLYKVDHAFMGIVVPQGKHSVEFRYAPESFFISEKVSLILSALVLLGLGLSIWLELKKKKKPAEEATKAETTA